MKLTALVLYYFRWLVGSCVLCGRRPAKHHVEFLGTLCEHCWRG